MQFGASGSVAVELQMERWLQHASRTAHGTHSARPVPLTAHMQPTPGGAMLLQTFLMEDMHAVDDMVVVHSGQESVMLRSAKVLASRSLK